MVNLLLIDSRIINYDKIIDSINDNTQYILFDFFNDSFQSLLDKMNYSIYNSVGLLQHNDNLPNFQMLSSMTPASLDNNNDFTSWNDFIYFITTLKNEKQIKKVLPGVHALAYEKVLFPFILISKKRYFALKYEDDPTKYKQLSMGLILKRRDNAPILKHCYIGVIDSLVKDKNIPKAIEYVQNECRKMVDGKFDMNMFVISKTLSSYYKDPEAIAHAVLAQRMADRDPGNKPQSNDRIPYVFIKIKEEPGIEYLQGDRIEHVEYVRKNKLQVDYEKYIENQIMLPVSQLFELVVERLPNFPYGRGYYDELYNIWYNKYDGDELKTEKKIKQLKAQMVHKLIFEPLIQYARIKVSNGKTIDEWFKPEIIQGNETNPLPIRIKSSVVNKTTIHEIKSVYNQNDKS